MSTKNLMIVQGGGPTAVFNTSLAAIILEGLGQPSIGKIYGARWGMKGLCQADVIDLTGISKTQLQALHDSPGAALGSSRYKPSDEDLKCCIDQMRALDIRHIIFMGGNGSMRGAELVHTFCRNMNFDVQIMGVPKTIDNDIAATDRSPGFGSAARYIAQATRDLGMDVRSLPQPVSILETMGRDVGWLAGATVMAKQRAEDAPHLIYLPEIAFCKEKFLADVDNLVSRQGWAVVVVSEGIRHEDGSPVYELGDPTLADPLSRPMIGGVGQHIAGIVAKELKFRCRSERPGLIGRASCALVSKQDIEDAELVGCEAVRALVAGETGKMVSLLPLAGDGKGFELVPLNVAAGPHRAIPAHYLTDGPVAVTESFRNYVRPLMGELIPYPPALTAGLQPTGVRNDL